MRQIHGQAGRGTGGCATAGLTAQDDALTAKARGDS